MVQRGRILQVSFPIKINPKSISCKTVEEKNTDGRKQPLEILLFQIDFILNAFHVVLQQKLPFHVVYAFA